MERYMGSKTNYVSSFVRNNKKVCVVHHDTLNKCGDSDLPRWVERLKGQIKEREGAKECSREDKNIGSGEGEGELSSVAGEEIVEVIPGGDGGHSQEDKGSLADAESTSDTLAYEGGNLPKICKKAEEGKGRYQNGWINMSGIVKNKRNIFCCMLGS